MVRCPYLAAYFLIKSAIMRHNDLLVFGKVFVCKDDFIHLHAIAHVETDQQVVKDEWFHWCILEIRFRCAEAD